MKEGELFKITHNGDVYFGIFKCKNKKSNSFYVIRNNFSNVVGISNRPTIPVPYVEFAKGTKVAKRKPKTFDREICIFGLCVRSGVFCDRLSISEDTVNELAELFERLRKSYNNHVIRSHV